LKGAQLNNRRKISRTAGAAALVACMVTAFAALGGVGTAQSAVSAGEGQYGKKVTICHKGKNTITISKKALPAHLRHGDTVGPCTSVAAKKAKAAKIKAAKVKAAKAKAAAAKAKHDQAVASQAKEDKSSGEKPGKGKGRGK
jgi:microcystin-dependent protein